MTLQSLSWAYEQRDVPGDAWRVLMALSNYTDHLTGKIHFDLDVIAGESCVQPNALPRYLGALRRNGYLAIDGKDKDKHFWLLMGRETSRPWDWNAQEIAEENDSAPSARPAPTNVPVRFQQAAQAKAREKVKPEPRTEYPIVEGSRADREWTAYLKTLIPPQKPPFIRWVLVDGQQRRGYPMPSLFPPKVEEQIAV